MPAFILLHLEKWMHAQVVLGAVCLFSHDTFNVDLQIASDIRLSG